MAIPARSENSRSGKITRNMRMKRVSVSTKQEASPVPMGSLPAELNSKRGKITRNMRPKRVLVSKKQEASPVPIGSLPADLLIEVLGRVASSSSTDLLNAMLCCKDFLGAARDDYIWQQISMEEFPLIPWSRNPSMVSFLDRCKNAGNPEALFRQGMIEYFSEVRVKLGVEYLKKASEKGHIEATYVYGLILLASKGSSSSTRHEQGLKLLNSIMNKSLSTMPQGWKIRDCREKVEMIIEKVWIRNYLIRRRIKLDPTYHTHEDENDTVCDVYRCHREVIEIHNMLHTYMRWNIT